jgi:hypothetical protein
MDLSESTLDAKLDATFSAATLLATTPPGRNPGRNDPVVRILHSGMGVLRAQAELDILAFCRTSTKGSWGLAALFEKARAIFKAVESPNGVYPVTRGLIALATNIVPHYHYHQARAAAASEHSASVGSTLGTLDLNGLLQFLCSDVFTHYHHLSYQNTTERWSLGLALMTLFDRILDTPPPSAYKSYTNPLKLVPLRQYLHNLFVTEPTMQKALLRPLQHGAELLEQLTKHHQTEQRDLLAELLCKSLSVTRKLLAIQKHGHARFQRTGSSAFILEPSLHSLLLHSTGIPSSRAHSLVQAVSFLALDSPGVELKCQALETITVLCRPGLTLRPPTLAGYFGATADTLRMSCLQALQGPGQEAALEEPVLTFLAAAFEFQPALAESMLAGPTAETASITTTTALKGLDELLKSYAAAIPELLNERPHVLEKIMHTLFCVWSVAPGYGNLAEELSNTEGFWEAMFQCLAPEDDDEDIEILCNRLLVRSWVMQVLAVELWSRRDALPPALVRQLQQAIEHKLHQFWLQDFTYVSRPEDGLHKLVDMADKIGVRLSVFQVSVDPLTSPGLELDAVHFDDVLLAQLQLGDAGLMTDSNEDESALRRLLLSTQEANSLVSLAGSQLVLLQSWRAFVQVCLLKHPTMLGFRAGCELPWTYMSQLCACLAASSVDKEPSVMAHRGNAEVGHLFLLLVSHTLGADTASTELLHEALHLTAKRTRGVDLSQEPGLSIDFAHCESRSDRGLLAASELLAEVVEVIKQYAKDLPVSGAQTGTAMDTTEPPKLENSLLMLRSLLCSMHLLLQWFNNLHTVAIESSLKPRSASPSAPATSSFLASVPEAEWISSPQQHHVEGWRTCEALIPVLCRCITQAPLTEVCLTLLPLALGTSQHSQAQQDLQSREVSLPSQVAVDAVGEAVPFLRSCLAAVSVTEAETALRILDVFITMSQCTSGARCLNSERIMMYLLNHHILRPPRSENEPAKVSFEPYEEFGARNTWHKVWCAMIRLVTCLMSQLHAEQNFADTALEFLHVYHDRLSLAISDGARSELTMGRLEEIEQVTSLLYDMEKLNPQWRFRMPAFAKEHERKVLTLSYCYAKLLKDPPELQLRAKAVSPEERKSAGLGDDIAAAEKLPSYVQKPMPKTRNVDENVPPPSPSINREPSFLLRSPALKTMGPIAAAEEATSSPKHRSIDIFTQQIEYRMCESLRNMLAFLRLLTDHYIETGELDMLYSHQLVASTGPLGYFGEEMPGVETPPRPPISVLIDVVRYSLQNLKRLSAVEAQDRSHEAGGATGEHLQQRWLRRFAPASDPTLLGIRQVLTMVMELALYVCIAHANVFVARHVATHFPAGYEEQILPEGADAGTDTGNHAFTSKNTAAVLFLQGYKKKMDCLLTELQEYVQHTPQSEWSLAEDYAKHSLPQLLFVLEEHVPSLRVAPPSQLIIESPTSSAKPRWSAGSVTPRSAAPLTPRFGLY